MMNADVEIAVVTYPGGHAHRAFVHRQQQAGCGLQVGALCAVFIQQLHKGSTQGPTRFSTQREEIIELIAASNLDRFNRRPFDETTL
ncbi:hypothetical protein ALP71_03182 [Pseudomonas coronafaciens pv. garcae]|nr:hypothetical protein ALP71_03182 [Pseudomonas coronafaciens pv. garcae]